MPQSEPYDVAIIGGGLAGLSCAVQLARKKFRVLLFEKEAYPFHKVCGEYISLECYDFLLSTGLNLSERHLPVVNRLQLSSPSGSLLTHPLPLGGFGISRYEIDAALSGIAKQQGVQVMESTRVNDVIFSDDAFNIITDSNEYASRMVCGAFGKRSNLDVRWKRPFTRTRPNALNNFIAVKYHAMLQHPRNTVSLHNFRDGYCGISPIENNKVCICYLTTARNLRENNNSVKEMESAVLARNPLLRKAFSEAEFLYDKPLAIAQVSFEKKELVHEHMLMLGDAASLIAPLCGNGMSMAMHSGRMSAALIENFLAGRITRTDMENGYTQSWNRAFSRRLQAGRVIQSLFGKEWLTNVTVNTLKYFPALLTRIIRQTHGTQRSEYSAG